MAIVKSIQGSNIGMFFPFAYWAVKLRDDRWLSEVDNKQLVIDPRIYDKTPIEQRILDGMVSPHIDKKQKITYDWTMDLVSTGDILKVRELWMFCPPNSISPQGNTATLFFKSDGSEAGTAFMFNVSNMHLQRRIDHKIIGKVTDKMTGDCTCFIWDDSLRVMSSPFKTNVNDFARWRDGVAPIGKLSHEVIGLRGISEKDIYHARSHPDDITG